MKKLKILSFFLLLFLTACQKPVTIETKEVTKTNTPTIFIHGYSGNSNTMNKMIKTLEKSTVTEEEMVIRVFEDGTLDVETDLKNEFSQNNPSINLIFDNNTSSQWHQAEWIKSALTYLKAEFKVEKVNIVGFSMGGISSFLYMETFSNDSTQPVVEKLVTIGDPFNEFIDDNEQSEESILEKGPAQISEQLANYQTLVQNLPSESRYFLIGGQISGDKLSDGTVPLNSSLGIYSLLKQNNLFVKHQIILGNEGKHSLLKKNPEVIQLVGNFIFEN
ncbi:alpha/beta fold hydrolase [Vagococcus fluvialis]|uniref:alpha/beta fold hydrolase n=1 Tax=Vagococcus fluvialis TaxID=2738 RepID=UPI001D0A1016|nr:alpha/beta fold hydrolase [Vagococcus fluvialis]UDM70836.1 alpha/beta fold hydrolase [Vagococcus fluvialis]UDM75692.1 alpha/beta fold hydrolase [Vagococcus fluvialis]UDM82523.1 alpha/beta fold hydrolase [Vagococcus fluvialis]